MHRQRTNLNWRINYSPFIASKDESLVQTTPTSLHKEKRGWCNWTLIFCVDVHTDDPPNSIRMHPPEPDPPSRLRADVINGWPHRLHYRYIFEAAVGPSYNRYRPLAAGYATVLEHNFRKCRKAYMYIILINSRLHDCPPVFSLLESKRGRINLLIRWHRILDVAHCKPRLGLHRNFLDVLNNFQT